MIDYIYLFIIIILFSSNCAILILLKREKIKTQKNKNPSNELNEFMMDLMQGEALVKITRISPNDIFLRSPRGR